MNKKVVVFNSVSLDGYFTGENGDTEWMHNRRESKEWDDFVVGNARSGGVLLYGRKTYEQMANFWPTPAAAETFPAVAEGINQQEKVVFSKTLDRAEWNNTRLVKSDMLGEVRKLKRDAADDLVILGSGSIVAQLAREHLIDEYHFVVVPVILGRGRTMFDGLREKLNLKLINTRPFDNGNVVLSYIVQAH